MKKYILNFKYLFLFITALVLTGCVHDDKYDAPNLNGYQCKDLTSNITISQVKNYFTGNQKYEFPAISSTQPELILEGYVSSTDETGNIYKTIYIQDLPDNPTMGLTISVNMTSTYSTFPQGSKIYISLNGLAIGTYGGVHQIGVVDPTVAFPERVGRIPETIIKDHIFRSCTESAIIKPKVLKLNELADKYIGCLIEVKDAEFDSKTLCTTFAPNGETVDKQLNDPTMSAATRLVRNSGYASFANQLLPSGKGSFIGVLGKYNSNYQFYINRLEDLKDMVHFPRKDGLTSDPCGFDPTGLTQKTVAEVKQLFAGSGNFSNITQNFYMKVKVTANDETANLYNSVYVEDATGGFRVNVNKPGLSNRSSLYQDPRFQVGKFVYIKLNGLSIGKYNGEFQLGQPNGANLGYVPEAQLYKYFFDSKESGAITATERTISQLTTDDVGKWIKLKDVEFTDGELDAVYATGAATASTNRNLKDCNGNTIIARTRNISSFAGITVKEGKGDLYAILSIFNNDYQLLIIKPADLNLKGTRCDGTIYTPLPNTAFSEDFSGGFATNNWTIVDVAGVKSWEITTQFGNPAPSALINGYGSVNEDWLISKEISLEGKTKASLSFDSWRNFTATVPLEVYVTTNYTGNPATTTWTAILPDLATSNAFVNSGKTSLTAFAGQKIRIAFKYANPVATSAYSYELDNIVVKTD